jgi:HD-like signal output (HDOD) protein
MTDPATTLDRLVARAERLYSLPAVAVQVLDLTRNPQVDTHALKACIENDPALAGKILRVVNSSLFGLSREVSDLQQALGLLGIKPLKLLVLGFSLPGGLFLDLEAKTLTWYWRRTLTKAIAAREMAQQLWRIPGDDAFLAGLFQDLGVLLLLQELGRPFARLIDVALCRRLDLGSLELRAVGFLHTELSARLLRHWRLPEALWEAVAWQGARGEGRGAGGEGRGARDEGRGERGDADRTVARPPALAQILHLAELMARLVVDGQPEALPQLLETGRGYYRQLEPQLEALVSGLGEKVQQLADVFSLELPGGLEYRDVLAEAHRRLAGVAGQVAEDMLGVPSTDRADPDEQGVLDEVEDLAAAVAAICRSTESSPAGSRVLECGNSLPLSCLPGRLAPIGGLREKAAMNRRTPKDEPAQPSAVDQAPLLDPLVRAVAASRRSRLPLSLLLVQLSRSGSRAAEPDAVEAGRLLRVLEAACHRVDHPSALCTAHGETGFALILPNCDRPRAVALGNQLVAAVGRIAAAGKDKPAQRLRLGAGVASVTLPPKNFLAETLLEGAARCLFGSLASGGVKSIEIY